MISNISIITGVILMLLLISLFFIIRSFSLPSSYFKNQAQREELLKKRNKAEGERKAVHALQEQLQGKEPGTEESRK